MGRLERDLAAWCASLVERARVIAVSVVVGRGGERVEAKAGEASGDGTLFDLASLTKPLSASLALALDAAGALPLATRVGDLWPRAGRIATVSLDGLLRHEAGLRRWMPLYAVCDDAGRVAERLLADDWVAADREPRYSDLDYLLWRLSVERALGRSYFDLLVEHLLRPLDVAAVAPTPRGGERAVRCPLTTAREVELAREEGLEIDEQPPPARGVAQDGNCRFLGQPGGHAGLFASAEAVWTVAREWCRPGRVFSSLQVDAALAGAGRFALGWFRSAETGAGRRLGAGAIGHDGFTGGTLWVDRQSDLVVVALCHRAALDVDLSRERAVLVDLAARRAGHRE
jgi:CubicO group peptidase (beta-lactamase class C family)